MPGPGLSNVLAVRTPPVQLVSTIKSLVSLLDGMILSQFLRTLIDTVLVGHARPRQRAEISTWNRAKKSEPSPRAFTDTQIHHIVAVQRDLSATVCRASKNNFSEKALVRLGNP